MECATPMCRRQRRARRIEAAWRGARETADEADSFLPATLSSPPNAKLVSNRRCHQVTRVGEPMVGQLCQMLTHHADVGRSTVDVGDLPAHRSEQCGFLFSAWQLRQIDSRAIGGQPARDPMMSNLEERIVAADGTPPDSWQHALRSGSGTQS